VQNFIDRDGFERLIENLPSCDYRSYLEQVLQQSELQN